MIAINEFSWVEFSWEDENGNWSEWENFENRAAAQCHAALFLPKGTKYKIQSIRNSLFIV